MSGQCFDFAEVSRSWTMISCATRTLQQTVGINFGASGLRDFPQHYSIFPQSIRPPDLLPRTLPEIDSPDLLQTSGIWKYRPLLPTIILENLS
jgi:hypothetical protein